MAGQTESCAVGAIGCLVIVVGGGVMVALVGGHFHIDLGGVFILLVIGGITGLVINGAYEKGKHDGAPVHAGGRRRSAPPGDGASVPGKARRGTPVFVPPWWGDSPATVSEALTHITEKFWSRDHPETKFSDEGATVTFRSRGVSDDRVLKLVASEDSDTVTIELRDALGEIFAPTGPWRSPSDSNTDLSEVFHFVESVLMETSVHVLSSSGEHRLAQRAEIEALVAADAGLRIASWNGSFDRGGA